MSCAGDFIVLVGRENGCCRRRVAGRGVRFPFRLSSSRCRLPISAGSGCSYLFRRTRIWLVLGFGWHLFRYQWFV